MLSRTPAWIGYVSYCTHMQDCAEHGCVKLLLAVICLYGLSVHVLRLQLSGASWLLREGRGTASCVRTASARRSTLERGLTCRRVMHRLTAMSRCMT